MSLKNFRCFESVTVHFDQSLIVITGNNGSGKSTLLEALHYGCYLRSFRTHMPREMIAFDQDNFFIKIILETTMYGVPDQHTIHIGMAGKKRLVKIDQQAIKSYKELTQMYSIVTLSEDDLELIKGSPESRRLFLDQALSMQQAGYVQLIRRYRSIVQHRNALIARGNFSPDDYSMWTCQLWDSMISVQQARIQFLENIAQRVNQLINQWFLEEGLSISFMYKAKQGDSNKTYEAYMQAHPTLGLSERKMGRSLIGAHLDDIAINFCNKTSRLYASRGQQKLILVLIKIAQALILLEQGHSVVLLLDDFMADFDIKRGRTLMELLLGLNIQIIITAPSASPFHEEILLKKGGQHLILPVASTLP